MDLPGAAINPEGAVLVLKKARPLVKGTCVNKSGCKANQISGRPSSRPPPSRLRAWQESGSNCLGGAFKTTGLGDQRGQGGQRAGGIDAPGVPFVQHISSANTCGRFIQNQPVESELLRRFNELGKVNWLPYETVST